MGAFLILISNSQIKHLESFLTCQIKPKRRWSEVFRYGKSKYLLNVEKNTKGEFKMAFGMPYRCEIDGFGVELRPISKAQIVTIVEMFSSKVVHEYTQGLFAATEEGELEWWEKIRNDKSSVHWGIFPDGSDHLVGFTGLNDIHPIAGTCKSGIIIADQSFWGKGVAYRAHLIRTLYATNELNRYTIQSEVRVPNIASRKALEKVGYIVGGKKLANWYSNGKFLDTYVLTWLNPHPAMLARIRPEGPLTEQERAGIETAQKALNLAEDYVIAM